jgi:hypothetical protein
MSKTNILIFLCSILTQGVIYDNTGYMLAQGKVSALCSESGGDCETQSSVLNNKHAVRCCSSTERTGSSWTQTCTGIWAASDLGGCQWKKYNSARDFCESKNARLCTKDELEDDCAAGTGCDWDEFLTWSSTPNNGADFELLVADNKCSSSDNNLGTFASVQQCARKVYDNGKRLFTFGKGTKAGICRQETTTNDDCSDSNNELQADDQWDFYKTARVPINAGDRSENDLFAATTAISGDLAIAGATGHDQVDSNAGAAYIYSISNGIWTQDERLTPFVVTSRGANSDRFGCSVAIDQQYAFVGAKHDDNALNDNENSGAVYVFTVSGTTWDFHQKLRPTTTITDAKFGISMALYGDYLLIGSSGEDTSSGAAYVFTLTNGQWTQTARIVANDRTDYDLFGGSVAIDDGFLIVGAVGTNPPSAYIFSISGDTFSQTEKVTTQSGNGAQDVAIRGDLALVGAPSNTGGNVYVFTRDSGVTSSWSETQNLQTTGPDHYGVSVSLSYSAITGGALALIGAYDDSIGGKAYMFKYCNDEFTEAWNVGGKSVGDQFGFSVSSDGDRTFIGADAQYDSRGQGYMIEKRIDDACYE